MRLLTLSRLAVCALLFLQSRSFAAPLPARMPPVAPEVRVGGYRIVVERLQQAQSIAVEYTEAGAKLSGSQQVFLSLAVHPPRPELAANIDGIDSRVVAHAAAESLVSFQSYQADETDPLATGVWRTSLIAQELDLAVSRLTGLKGELVVYPRARRVTLDYPLPLAAPLTRESEGVRAILKQARLQSGSLIVSIEMQTPAEARISRVNSEASDGVTALTRAGSILVPRRESMNAFAREGLTVKQYTFAFPEVKEMPAQVRVELMLRTGTPRRLPFTLPEIVLPDAQDLQAELAKIEGDASSLDEEHPLFARGGGTLQVPVRLTKRDEPGRLVIGLRRGESGSNGTWRWLEAPLGRDGVAILANLRPGSYQVSAAWIRDGSGSSRAPAAPIEVEVTAGKSVRLPAIAVGESR